VKSLKCWTPIKAMKNWGRVTRPKTDYRSRSNQSVSSARPSSLTAIAQQRSARPHRQNPPPSLHPPLPQPLRQFNPQSEQASFKSVRGCSSVIYDGGFERLKVARLLPRSANPANVLMGAQKSRPRCANSAIDLMGVQESTLTEDSKA